ncbi:hypothetical protein BHM03_00009350 [Ensete ventricosum]|nr:hypothetical protein BHM03_00009350 [Ensete ventricosum]
MILIELYRVYQHMVYQVTELYRAHWSSIRPVRTQRIERYDTILQTVEVNTLNGYFGSGGPLLDSKGNMIGINTAIFTNTGMILLNYLHIAGASAGVGFAIPSSTVLRIVPQLIQFGKVGSPYI